MSGPPLLSVEIDHDDPQAVHAGQFMLTRPAEQGAEASGMTKRGCGLKSGQESRTGPLRNTGLRCSSSED